VRDHPVCAVIPVFKHACFTLQWRPTCLGRRMSQRRSGTYNTAKQKEFRKNLRNSMTPAECVLWQSLKGRQLLGKKFRRQSSIGRYVVDFYSPEARLVIELDGERHFSMTIENMSFFQHWPERNMSLFHLSPKANMKPD
jgi:hypothetical protein